MSDGLLLAWVQDVHELALGMQDVTLDHGPRGSPGYQVGGESFVFFRTPRADAYDPASGERFSDVIVLLVASESEKQALVQDPMSPFLTQWAWINLTRPGSEHRRPRG